MSRKGDERRKERYAQDPEYRALIKARSRAHYHANKGRHQNKHLKYNYGITQAEYDALLAKQRGACAICGTRPKEKLYVDHCHVTGRIRGLLCRGCNFALGCLKENQRALIAALAYLAYDVADGPGAAAQRALLAHAALPPRRARTAPPAPAQSAGRYDRASVARMHRTDRATPVLRPTTRGRAALPMNSIPVQPNGGDMSIDDVPPDGGTATRPMWEALVAELRRESEDGDGRRAGILQLVARKLAAKALDGDLGAIKEIFDRMDGKSVAGAAPDQDRPEKVVFQWKDPQ